jgi:L-ascorbate metabolism protein UlaG (beta-lactamase superfamily)
MKRGVKRLLFGLLGLAVVLAAGTWLVFQLQVFGGPFEGERLARMQRSPQFDALTGRFENKPPYVSQLSFWREMQAWFGQEVREPTFVVPVLPLAEAQLAAAPAPGLRAWWLGHASTLIEIDGVRVLTDPVFSERVSPFQFVGPARLHRVPLALAQWKNIDAVVISHDHFDHLDMATVQQLAQGGTHFYVGLGIGAHLARWGVPAAQIHELDWWESAQIKGLTIHCTPARHYSGRKSMDNSTLWTSWLLQGPASSAYYSGDTGYAGHFKAIRARLGAPQLAVLKVGAYGDTWLDIHMSPESAVQAHGDLGASTLLPVHWGTFNLAYHAWAEPIERTRAAAERTGAQLVTPRVGEPVEVGRPFASTAWWRR